MVAWVAGAWDGVALWLTQLPFAFQFTLVIVVLAPACLGIAWVIDRAVELASAKLAQTRDRQSPTGPPNAAGPPPVVGRRTDS